MSSQVCPYGQTIGITDLSGKIIYFFCGGIITNMPMKKCEIPDDDTNIDMQYCGVEDTP